jgi:sporulation protein YlmC with PRC-barrel domain
LESFIMTENIKNLFDLDDLSEYEVADDYSDIRGWDVMDANRRTIGKVDHLLVDKKAEQVVYIVVKVNRALLEEGFSNYEVPVSAGVHAFLDRNGDNHLAIPIGLVTLDEENKNVCLQ